jgi:hypothetical protein
MQLSELGGLARFLKLVDEMFGDSTKRQSDHSMWHHLILDMSNSKKLTMGVLDGCNFAKEEGIVTVPPVYCQGNPHWSKWIATHSRQSLVNFPQARSTRDEAWNSIKDIVAASWKTDKDIPLYCNEKKRKIDLDTKYMDAAYLQLDEFLAIYNEAEMGLNNVPKSLLT